MKKSKRFVQKGRTLRVPRAAPSEGLRGFDLTTVRPTDIDGVEYNVEEKTLTITYTLPTGRGEDFCEFVDTFSLGHGGDAPGYVIGAMRTLNAALLRATMERAKYDGELPCATCKGMCCVSYDEIEVNEQDYERMREAGLNLEEAVALYEQTSPTGHVGTMIKVPWYKVMGEDGNATKTSCTFLKPDGCSIYEVRPLICREFSAWTCDIHEADVDKTRGKYKLRVVT